MQEVVSGLYTELRESLFLRGADLEQCIEGSRGVHNRHCTASDAGFSRCIPSRCFSTTHLVVSIVDLESY